MWLSAHIVPAAHMRWKRRDVALLFLATSVQSVWFLQLIWMRFDLANGLAAIWAIWLVNWALAHHLFFFFIFCPCSCKSRYVDKGYVELALPGVMPSALLAQLGWNSVTILCQFSFALRQWFYSGAPAMLSPGLAHHEGWMIGEEQSRADRSLPWILRHSKQRDLGPREPMCVTLSQ